MRTVLQMLACLLAFVAGPGVATDVAKGPLQSTGLAKPNLIFGMDDSGSMDLELLLNTNEGLLWYDYSAHASARPGGWAATGAFNTNPSGTYGGTGYYRMGYLFPNGCGTGQRNVCDSSSVYAIPPTAQFAALRSSSYNPQYYDPAKTYEPWVPASVAGVSKTFTAATANAAKSHPLFTPTMNLQAVSPTPSTTGEYFKALPGMVLPVGTTGAYSCGAASNSALASAMTVGVGKSCNVGVPYWPATYWVKTPCTVDGVACASAPDGSTLKRYEIRSTVTTYPSGRTYAAELANFANWFQYYRKRKLGLASSMGQVLEDLSGLRMGLLHFNASKALTMYDTDAADAASNGRAVAGLFYANPAAGGTPTRQTLSAIGEAYRTNTSVIQYSCQRNAAFIVTDGYAADSTVSVPSYSQSTWGAGAPYATTHTGTLADLALAYYTVNLRPTLATGKVPAAPATSSDPAADKNSNLHMNTYAITLGSRGEVWPAVTDAYATPVTWQDVTAGGSPVSIDDLWHATINGRGQMYRATTPEETAVAMKAALNDIQSGPGGQGSVAYSTINLKSGDSTAYLGLYKPQGWSGDAIAAAVDTTSGAVSATPLWSASERLATTSPASRKLVTYLSGAGVPLSAATDVLSNAGAYGAPADVLAYVRGDRTMEGTVFRTRTSLMGAVINAEPAVSRTEGVVFVAANDGMLHALDKATGTELWAYVPGSALAGVGAQTQKSWTFTTLLDGTPVLATVEGKTLLAGGRGGAGSGYYALDVTGAKSLSEAGLAARVLWEFPNASTSAEVTAAVGSSVGRPVFANTALYGWVALLTSGYNSQLDGKGRVFVLDARTGVLKATLVTSHGSVGANDAGLAQISGFTEPSGLVRYVYGGDELGYLWRFDLDGGTVLEMGRLTNSAGAPLPVTAAPELGVSQNRRLVLVGTGRLLGQSDFSDTGTHTFFAVADNGASAGNLRSVLAQRAVTLSAGVRRATGAAIDWVGQRGWYADLPAGEKANTTPSLAYGVIAWTTNTPSATSCSSSSALYVADAQSGLELPASSTEGTPYYGLEAGNVMSSRVALARLPDGRIVVTTRRADNTTFSKVLSVAPQVAARKLGWKEVRR